MPFAGLIFDFNGVLLWDTALHEAAWQQMADELRGRPFTPDEFLHQVHGRPNATIITYLVGAQLPAAETERLYLHKETIYRELCLAAPEHFRLSPGASDLLDWLADHAIPRTIATASERTNLDFFIEHLGLARWFDVEKIVFDDGIRPGKPAPDIYLEAAKALALPPEACVVIEDAVAGLKAATEAGIGQVLALGPQGAHARLANLPGVNRVISDLTAFPRDLLKKEEGC